MSKLLRRHSANCQKVALLAKRLGHAPSEKEKRTVENCECGIHIQGSIGGKFVRKGLNTIDWSEACHMLVKMEAEAQLITNPKATTINEAWIQFNQDMEHGHLSKETVRKYSYLEKAMKAFAEDKGLKRIREFNLENLSAFQSTWTQGDLAKDKQVERVRRFFRFCLDREWLPTNPAKLMTKGKQYQKFQTDPLSIQEQAALWRACDEMKADAIKENVNVANTIRLKPLLMTQRYAGLRLSDANKLMPTQIQGNRIVIEETTKTGTGIYVTVPAIYLAEMAKVDKKSPRYFFWSGNGDPVTQVKDWQALILQAFTRAKITKGATQMMSHRMRDTFAKDYMETGGDIEDLARILGHGNSNITRAYYLKWSVRNQEKAALQAKKTWTLDPLQNPQLLKRKSA